MNRRAAQTAVASARPSPSRPRSFLEVRVAAGRVEILEFGGLGRSERLRALLRRLGLATYEEWSSPCG